MPPARLGTTALICRLQSDLKFGCFNLFNSFALPVGLKRDSMAAPILPIDSVSVVSASPPIQRPTTPTQNLSALATPVTPTTPTPTFRISSPAEDQLSTDVEESAGSASNAESPPRNNSQSTSASDASIDDAQPATSLALRLNTDVRTNLPSISNDHSHLPAQGTKNEARST